MCGGYSRGGAVRNGHGREYEPVHHCSVRSSFGGGSLTRSQVEGLNSVGRRASGTGGRTLASTVRGEAPTVRLRSGLAMGASRRRSSAETGRTETAPHERTPTRSPQLLPPVVVPDRPTSAVAPTHTIDERDRPPCGLVYRGDQLGGVHPRQPHPKKGHFGAPTCTPGKRPNRLQNTCRVVHQPYVRRSKTCWRAVNRPRPSAHVVEARREGCVYGGQVRARTALPRSTPDPNTAQT